MKKIGKILVVFVLLFVIIAIAVQIFGVKYLKKTVDKFVLPKIEEVVGVDVAIADLSLNLLKGDVRIEGVVLGNPEGYKGDLLTIGRFTTDLKMTALLKKEVYINKLLLKDVHLSVMSKGVKSLNVLDVANYIAETTASTNSVQASNTDESSIKLETDNNEVVATKKDVTDFALKDSAFNFLFSFVMLPGDYIKEEYQLDWNLIFEAKDITNVGDGANTPGSIKIQSGDASKPNEPQVDINGIIYPLTNMSEPSFAINGSILKFDMTDIEEWCEALGIGSSDLDLRISMVCEKGVYTDSSNIEFKFKNPKLYGSLADQAGNIQLPNELNVKVPVKGSWDEPKIDLQPALTKVVFDVTKSTLINKYVPEEYKETAKDLGDTLQEGLDSLFKK